MNFGRGFVADTHATHQGSAAAMLVGATPGKRPSAYLKQIYNQGQTETCVAWAIKLAIELRAAALGIPVPPLSAAGIYALTKQLQQAFEGQTSQPLVDNGSQPSLAVQALRSYGAPTEAQRPWNPANVCAKLSIADLQSADTTFPWFIKGFYGIVEVGAARGARVRQLLDASIPIIRSIPSSTGSFESPDGQVLTAPTMWVADNHMTTIIDYGPPSDESSDYDYEDANQWGESWNGGGTYKSDDSFLQYSNNLFAIDIAPVTT